MEMSTTVTWKSQRSLKVMDVHVTAVDTVVPWFLTFYLGYVTVPNAQHQQWHVTHIRKILIFILTSVCVNDYTVQLHLRSRPVSFKLSIFNTFLITLCIPKSVYEHILTGRRNVARPRNNGQTNTYLGRTSLDGL